LQALQLRTFEGLGPESVQCLQHHAQGYVLHVPQQNMRVLPT